MAVRFILMMALIMIGSGHPGPDPDVRVDVSQIVNARCGGGCCDDNCCTFEGKKYRTGDYVEAECMEFCCKSNGQWEFKGINENCCTFNGSECIFQVGCMKLRFSHGILKYEGIVKDCGNCIADGDPHIHPFDPIIYPSGSLLTIPKYRFNFSGEFVIAQPNFRPFPAPFGVNGIFEPCTPSPSKGKVSCIKSITYYEPGIEIKLEVDAIGLCSGAYIGPKCTIKAEVKLVPHGSFTPQTVSGSVATISGGNNGPILLFEYTLPSQLSDDSPPFNPYKNVNCIIIVGTQGFSVALCSVEDNWAFLYIWAMPGLENTPNYIHGLCNTYTGKPAADFEPQSGIPISASTCITQSPIYQYNDVCWPFAHTWCAYEARCYP